MFSQSNYLPQISQIGFNPQPMVPQVDQYRNAVMSQQIFDAPLRRAMQVAQLEQQQFSNQLALKNLEFREQEFDFRKQLNEQVMVEKLDAAREKTLTQANKLTGIAFANPTDAARFESYLEEDGLTMDNLATIVDANDVEVREWSGKIQKTMMRPEVRDMLKKQTQFDLTEAEILKNPAKYDLNAWAPVREAFSTGSQEIGLKDLTTSNFLIKEDPRDTVLTKQMAIVEQGGVDTPATRDRFVSKLAEVGISEEEADAYYAQATMKNINIQEIGEGVANMLGLPELTGDIVSTLETARKLGKTQLETAITTLQADALRTRREIRVAEVKGEQERLTKLGTNGVELTPLMDEKGVYQAASTEFDITNPDAQLVINAELKEDDPQFTPEGVSMMGLDPDTMEEKPITITWDVLTPDDANKVIIRALNTSAVNSVDRVSDARNQRMNLTNQLPIKSSELSRYSDVTQTYFKLDEGFVGKNPNYTYKSRGGFVLTNDPRFAGMAVNAKNVFKGDVSEQFIVVPANELGVNANTSLQNPTFLELGNLVASTESTNAGGYNAYNFDKANTVGGKNPLGLNISEKTLGEVRKLQTGTRTAVGKYQFVGSTLQAAMDYLGYDENTTFSPEVQEDMFHNYLIMGHKRIPLRNYIRGVEGYTRERAIQEVQNEFEGLKKDPAKAAKFVDDYKAFYDSRLDAASEALSGGPIYKDPADIIGYTGQTGYSTGPHVDVRLVDEQGKPIGPPDRYLSQILIDGKPISSFTKTSSYNEDPKKGRVHKAVDYGIPQGRVITFADPNLIEEMYVAGDSKGLAQPTKGSGQTSGGIYTHITFKNGDNIRIMHQAPETVLGGDFAPNEQMERLREAMRFQSDFLFDGRPGQRTQPATQQSISSAAQIPEEVRDSLRTAYQNVQW